MLYALQYAFKNQKQKKNMTTKEKEVGVQMVTNINFLLKISIILARGGVILHQFLSDGSLFVLIITNKVVINK